MLTQLPRVSEQSLVIGAAMVVATLGAVGVGARPTGIGWWDVALTASFAALVTLAASAAKRWSLVVLSVVSVLIVGFSIWIILGGAALLGSVASLRMSRRNRMIGAVVAALALQPLLRAPEIIFWSLPSFVAAVGVLPVFITSFVSGSKAVRRRIRWVALVFGLALLVGVASTVSVAARGRAPVEQGIRAARDGLAAAGAGDTAATSRALQTASSSLAEANEILDSPLSAPARLLPIVSQHLRAGRTATQQGELVARAAAEASLTADVQALRVDGGNVDLSVLTRTYDALVATNAALVNTDTELALINTDWLIPQLVDGIDDLRIELATGLEESALAQEALRVVPPMLGSERPQRYLVLLAQPAESREMGGFVGAYALIEANNGELSLVDAHSTSLYWRDFTDPLDNPEPFSVWYLDYELAKFPQNITGSPDPLTVAAAVADLFPEFRGAPIDGVMYLDPIGIGAFVDLLGPVDIPELGRSFDRAQIEEFLLRGQYIEFPDNAERKDFLISVLEQVFDRIVGAELAGPARLGEVFGPVARAGHLALSTTNEDAHAFLRRMFLLRDFPAPDGRDFLSVTHVASIAGKMDAYLRRSVGYDVQFDPSNGAMSGKVTVALESTAPAGLPDYVTAARSSLSSSLVPGTNRVLLSIYTPHTVRRMSVDGQPTYFPTLSEYGYSRPIIQVEIPAGETVVVEYELSGTALPGDYAVTLANQALSYDDQFRLAVTPVEGWSLGAQPVGETVNLEFPLTEDTDVILKADS